MIFLEWAWPVYLLAVFTFGRHPDLIGLVMWGGVLFPAVLSLVAAIHFRALIRIEQILFFWVILWAALSAVVSGILDVTFARYLVQFAVVSFLVAIAVSISHSIKPFAWSLWLTGIYLSYTVFAGAGDFDLEILGARTRHEGVLSSPNLLGVFAALGVLGGLVLLPLVSSYLSRVVLVAGVGISLIGVIASASRGGLVLTAVYFSWWILVCLKGRLRHPALVILLGVLIGSAAIAAVPWLIESTRMGQRMDHWMVSGLDQDSRWDLMLKGWSLALENPLLGVSLGGYAVESGTGFGYAHNDFADIAASLGIVGFGLYVSIYLVVWRRLDRARRSLTDPDLVYMINVARMILVGMLVSGALFRPNFTATDVWIMMGVAMGTSWFAIAAVSRHRTALRTK